MDLVLAPTAGDPARFSGAAIDPAVDPVISPTADDGSADTESFTIADVIDWAATDPARRVVWADTAGCYPAILRAGARLDHTVDLRLVHRILARAAAAPDGAGAANSGSVWDVDPAPADAGPTLFEADGPATLPLPEVVAEHRRQRRLLAGTHDGGRLRLLCHAESIGALIAQELNHVGLPFDAAVHHRRLIELLGEPGLPGGRPARMETLCARIRTELAVPGLNPDSPGDVLTALRRNGLEATSTRQWELEQLEHPVIAPLLEYKKLARLHSANGWAWLRDWVHDGRFRSDWVAGGVVTGRWASRGGGALQLPKQIRGAVRAEAGHRLVVADAAQLEPRVLAAMSSDRALARACRGADLYQGLVDQGVVATRDQAKVGVLAAMYGGTSGQAAAVLPRLSAAYPDAIAVVEDAARTGERGGRVRTWLGRTSPDPPPWWRRAQRDGQTEDAGAEGAARARWAARDWGRFTRNFVVQGTAAEWALCWLGHLRRALRGLDGAAADPELVYFLHDEVIVHAPVEQADAVAGIVRDAAVAAGGTLFGSGDVEFAVTVAVVDAYDRAK